MDELPHPFEHLAQLQDAALRLDVLVVSLVGRLGYKVSRAAVQQWIAHGRVSINGQSLRPSARVRPGSKICVDPEPPPPSEAVADPSVDVHVIYEDDSVIVIDKPAGLVVHPARGHMAGTLVNGLLARGSFDLAPADGRDPAGKQRPGIVHRLDKDTSGVMVVARTSAAREALKDLFAQHDIEREYRAVVVGRARDASFDTPFGRDPTDRLRFTSRAGPRRARTQVRVLEQLAGGRAGLVACTLDTGRTHQIRVHLALEAHTPVLGDRLYGGRIRDPQLAAIARSLGRQWLHAIVLGFRHPVTKTLMRFESPLTAELIAALEALRRL